MSEPSSTTHRLSKWFLPGLCAIVALFGTTYWMLRNDRSEPVETASSSPTAPAATPPSARRMTTAERPVAWPGLVVRDEKGLHHPAPAALPLREALSPESGLTAAQRLAIIHGIDRPLTQVEVRAFLTFIETNVPLPEISLSQRQALENDLLNLLHAQVPFHAEIRAVLKRIASDPNATPIRRDYALQHLASLRDHDPSGEATLHWEIIESGPAPLAATAMLHLLADLRHPGGLTPADRTRLSAAALRLVEQPDADPIPLATALQVCARLQVEAARAPALRIATSEQYPFPLRIAAVATLGDLPPTEEVLTLLTTLETGREKRLRLPAHASLTRLKSDL